MKKKRILLAAAAAALLAAGAAASNLVLLREEIDVYPAGLPKEFDGFRIALVSDVHGRFACRLEKLVALLREEKPDVIAYTGDAVNDFRDSTEDAAELMRRLAAIAPVYYAPGNHEYASGLSGELFSAFRSAGAEVLAGESTELTRGDGRLVLWGADDCAGHRDLPPLSEMFWERGTDGACGILLCHRYDRAEEAAELGFSLMLAGHAHGGLVRLPFTDGLVGPGHVVLPKRTSGYYRVGNMELVVSRGLGNAAGIPRVGSLPHLPVVTLRCG